jgi:hypothetical protein
MRALIYTRDGRDHVSIAPILKEELLPQMIANNCGDGRPYDIVDYDGEMIQNFYNTSHRKVFRDAWECTSGQLEVNLSKARGLHMNCIRHVRNEELVKRDVTFMRAVEAGDTDAQATIATEKQTLRDIPQTFDLTTDTSEELNAKWPSELPARE